MSSRPSWDEYFMEITQVVAKRATCTKRNVGAVIVKDHRVLSSGYNGTPKGIEHCDKRGCLRKEQNVPSGQRHELCRGLHAEQNAIIQAAWHGVKIKDSTMYCTHQPCIICVKMMINAGIKELVYSGGYPDKLAEEMLKESEIKVRKI
ncbi:cytidine/deoxycytidylate deaminase family protein [Candidatus Margulisiibacteriota bacterium]